MDSLDCLPILPSISVFDISVFPFSNFSVVSSVRQIKLTRVGFRAHVKLAYLVSRMYSAVHAEPTDSVAAVAGPVQTSDE